MIAYLYILGDGTSLAQSVYRKNPNWSVPSLWRHEFLQILSTFVKEGGMPLPHAGRIWDQAIGRFVHSEQTIHYKRALVLANEFNINTYDAQALELSQRLDITFVSQNKRLKKAMPQIVTNPETYIK
ncbi:MAG: type II toxin-antitoxin system VapC family toxin [Candidatus Marinimicrobia bacterium]|nr:type II toxin-antitoxin system VapC family toxin [Candidatus Neomarinimicrobiota bacterium]MBT3675282.1 type II toxin-antitoxin system VapC family toxin [Candidatus Neomarinimicrobiota bacterium]MBT3763265.1 type II toxin-antitoxin system VapC family toxin [Candidatus Neomarinimicrobiota bacterium]MBT4068850.1 type II toxin-antitoxin system VapC family toxin [Candidatus Neomarinimicrobiota bacterium]MBT4269796.1 type II toxin-antitoxin system VapC family toxin [Candidatus Neomarinimicrobiota